MREILFRGKCVDTGKWYEGQYINLHKTTFCFAVSEQRERENEIHQIVFDRMTDWDLPNEHLRVDVLPETVGQYTGLTDKNGKKIFEGDILSVTVREIVKECGIRKFTGNTIKTVWSVEYAERRSQGNGFYVFGKDRRFSLGLTKSVIYNVNPEVIGNIHDNPELLKGADQ